MRVRTVSFLVIAGSLVALMALSNDLSSAQSGSATPTLLVTHKPTAALPAGNETLLRGIALKATMVDGVPNGIDQTTWLEAFGTVLTPDPEVSATTLNPVVIRFGNLVPNGMYSVWWGDDGATTNIRALPDTPDNVFQADANGYSRVVLNLNLRTLGQRLMFAVLYHPGGSPAPGGFGKLGVDSFRQLVSAFPDTRGISAVAGTALPTLTPSATLTLTPTITLTPSITSTPSNTPLVAVTVVTATSAAASATNTGTTGPTNTAPPASATAMPSKSPSAIPSMAPTAPATSAATMSATP